MAVPGIKSSLVMCPVGTCGKRHWATFERKLCKYANGTSLVGFIRFLFGHSDGWRSVLGQFTQR